jgi:hypothetical protein
MSLTIRGLVPELVRPQTIPMVKLFCRNCEEYTEIYVGRTKEFWFDGYHPCPVCGKKDDFWRDVFIDVRYNGCVFTVYDRRVE